MSIGGGDLGGLAVAVVGMAGRFPGAADVAQYWRNLCAGMESITDVTDEELLGSGLDPARLEPGYVRRGAFIEGEDLFDAGYFDYSPREAALIDPQQRLFLETAVQAFHDAGCEPALFDGLIGVFASAGISLYPLNLLNDASLTRTVGEFSIALGNEKDYLATRVAYKLNLRGPAITVQTACSSSLVAVHQACQALLAGDCDMAIAGGVSVRVPQRVGYGPGEGIASLDGRCRTFDAEASGTVTGNGVGVVVLRRLEDALADGDTVRAVIRGTAVNNDGAGKIGYTAPSPSGQSRVIRSAQSVAEVGPETIGYVEAHGTATPLGDPIEVAALTEAFGSPGGRTQWCALGSVKTNIGHLDAAAGIAALIKVVLSVEHGMVPPSLHFRRPNPDIDFASSPFFVNTSLRSWPLPDGPRRAGVSSFGIGGTNAHVIVEQAPDRARRAEPELAGVQTLVLSARSPSALARMADDLADRLEADTELSLADSAWTLRTGRPQLSERLAVVAADRRSAVSALRRSDEHIKGSVSQARQLSHPVFLFPGQGSQYAGMGADLYAAEPVFRREFDMCADLVRPHLSHDLRMLLGMRGQTSAASDLESTAVVQPALFALEYATAQTLQAWGIQPVTMIGHSIGEYVAACLAGVFDLDDALRLVTTRGRLIGGLPRGAMAAVSTPLARLEQYLLPGVEVAAVNGPRQCVVSGSFDAVRDLEDRLSAHGVSSRRLRTSHAFHSAAMEPILREFSDELRRVRLREPERPYLSNVTGGWSAEAAVDRPDYWVRHLRAPVLFAAGLSCAVQAGADHFVEVGPGTALSHLIRGLPGRVPAVPTLAAGTEEVSSLHRGVARLWVEGSPVDWRSVSARPGARVPLPPVRFDSRSFWHQEKEKEPPSVAEAGIRAWSWSRRELVGRRCPGVALVVASGPLGLDVAAELAKPADTGPGMVTSIDTATLANAGCGLTDTTQWLETLDAAGDGLLTVADVRALDRGPAGVGLGDLIESAIVSGVGGIRVVGAVRGAARVESSDRVTDTGAIDAARLQHEVLGRSRVSLLTVDVGDDPESVQAGRLLATECRTQSRGCEVALRGGLRWEAVPVPIPETGEGGWVPRSARCAIVGESPLAARWLQRSRDTSQVAVITDPDVSLFFHNASSGVGFPESIERADGLVAVVEQASESGTACLVHVEGEGAPAVSRYLSARLGGLPDCSVVLVPTEPMTESMVDQYVRALGRVRAREIDLRPDSSAVPASGAEPPVPTGSTEPAGPSRSVTTATEQEIAQIWRDVLGVEEVAPDDDFFAMGGHSLIASRVASRLRALYSVEISVRDLLEHPVLGDLARVVDAGIDREQDVAGPRKPERISGTTGPLSAAQERIWFYVRMQPHNPMWTMLNTCRLDGDLDLAALNAAARELVRRQWSLRTAFRYAGVRPYQEILPTLPFDIPVVDLSSLPEQKAAAQTDRLVDLAAQTVIDIEAGSPILLQLVVLGPRRHLLVFGFHHIVSDHWSTGLFLDELFKLYSAFATGGEPPLAELAVQYIDYAERQHTELSQNSADASMRYWIEQLADTPAVALRSAKARPPVPTFRGRALSFELSAEATAGVEELASDCRATPFMVFAAALYAMVYGASGQRDICIGTLTANRDTPDLERIIGLFVNPLALRCQVDPNRSFRELIADVRETCLDAYNHAHVPFERVVRELRIERDSARNPLYQIALVVENSPGAALVAHGLDIDVVGVNNATSKLDLTFALYQEPRGHFHGFAEFALDVFEPDDIRVLLDAYFRLITVAAAEPAANVGRLCQLAFGPADGAGPESGGAAHVD
ncbi:acyl transferase domain-containing protein [Catenulispora sp. EB89]|uniref:condensation domain-containing protein n=1 Tax=Catenulispora sp. EB89 TaxID=3156257 RepID=UPI003511FAD4